MRRYTRVGCVWVLSMCSCSAYRVGLMLPYTYTPYFIDIMSKIWCVSVRQYGPHGISHIINSFFIVSRVLHRIIKLESFAFSFIILFNTLETIKSRWLFVTYICFSSWILYVSSIIRYIASIRVYFRPKVLNLNQWWQAFRDFIQNPLWKWQCHNIAFLEYSWQRLSK